MKPNFTGLWMPKEVLENESLTLGEKFTYSIIDALDGDEGCYASNAYIGSILNLENRQIQNNLNKLIKMGLVLRIYDSKGSRRLRTVASHAIKCIPPMQYIAHPPCNPLHPKRVLTISPKFRWIGPKLIAKVPTKRRINTQAAVIFQFQISPRPSAFLSLRIFCILINSIPQSTLRQRHKSQQAEVPIAMEYRRVRK